MKALTPATITNILSLLSSGLTVRVISARTGYSTGVISNLNRKHFPDKPRDPGGQPKLLTPHNIRHGIRILTSGKADTAVQLARVLQGLTNKPINPSTVRRGLQTAGMKAIVKRKRPFLTKRHKNLRMDFAVAHQFWTVEDWKKVWWSDESKINRFGSDGCHWGWKMPGEALSDRLVDMKLKFGGGHIMIWGCFLWDGIG
jgi:hypothetical protein